jgi:hypothetical protein
LVEKLPEPFITLARVPNLPRGMAVVSVKNGQQVLEDLEKKIGVPAISRAVWR